MALLQLPESTVTLEEVNLPAHLAKSLAGRTVDIQVLPEELPGARRVELGDYPLLIYPDGSCWNDYRPLRVSVIDPAGNPWRLPRGWLQGPPTSGEAELAPNYYADEVVTFMESMHLPSFWDLLEINVPEEEASCAAGQPVHVRIRVAPREQVKVFWQDSQGADWQLPHNWRRRRVRIPDREKLLFQGIPRDVAEEFATQIVSVNYHPESLCCLPEQYRFRDRDGNRYPVYIKDCPLLGYGDATEHLA